MWKLTASLTIIIGIVISLCSPNAEDNIKVLGENIVSAYEYSKAKIEENPTQATAIATPIITTAIWASIIFLLRIRDRGTFEIARKFLEITEKPREYDNPIVEKAKAQILYEKLKQELVILEGRIKWLPDEIALAQQQLGDANHERNVANNNLSQKESKVKAAEIRLDKLLKESSESDKEIKAITQELEKLKEMI